MIQNSSNVYTFGTFATVIVLQLLKNSTYMCYRLSSAM